MNSINDTINFDEIIKSCRSLNPEELMYLLRADFWKFASWGGHAFTVDNKSNPKMFRMAVNGRHHKGHVYIFVNGLDLFDVYLTTLKGKIVDKTSEQGLYFDQLVEWIDKKIEYIPAYRD